MHPGEEGGRCEWQEENSPHSFTALVKSNGVFDRDYCTTGMLVLDKSVVLCMCAHMFLMCGCVFRRVAGECSGAHQPIIAHNCIHLWERQKMNISEICDTYCEAFVASRLETDSCGLLMGCCMTHDVRWHVMVTMVTVAVAPAFAQLWLTLNTSRPFFLLMIKLVIISGFVANQYHVKKTNKQQ